MCLGQHMTQAERRQDGTHAVGFKAFLDYLQAAELQYPNQDYLNWSEICTL